VSTASGAPPTDDSVELSSSAAYVAEQAQNSPLAETLHQLPSYVSRGLLYLILLFAITILVYCSFSKIDVTRSAAASIVPEGKLQQIQSDADGVITQILIREGEQVVSGQVLAIVDSQEVVSQLSALRAAQADLFDSRREQEELLPLKEQQLRAKIEILKEKIKNLEGTQGVLAERITKEDTALEFSNQLHKLELQRLNETLKRIDIEVKNANAAVELWTTELATIEALVEKKAASELEHLNVKRSMEAAVGEVEKLMSTKREELEREKIEEVRLLSAKNSHEKAIAEIREVISQNQVAIQSARLEQVQLEQEIELTKLEASKRHQMVEFRHKQALAQARLNLPGVDGAMLERISAGEADATDKTVIRAPLDGMIAQLHVVNTGETVIRGRTLMTLVPKDTRLLAEVRIPNKDVGLLNIDMPTRLKFDAFPFGEYGVINGQLERIVSVADSADGAASFYRAYSSLDQDYFLVKGAPVKLMPGMTATIEVITERKSILSLLLQPFLEFGKPRTAKS
jgi:HlyD family secretion protein